MSVLNSTVLERAWINGSSDFQQRIPNPTISSYANVVENLFAPMNNDLFNEFLGMLNGLNGTYVDTKRWESQFKAIKKPAAQWGNSERHVAVKYLQAHAGFWNDETLLKVERPEVVEWFYSVQKPRRYEFSWSRQEIAQAFAQDGYGYEDLLSATITQMLNSADYDEMNIMLQMFAEADNRMGGIFRYNLSAAPTTKATAEELAIGIRAIAGRMQTAPTMLYNHIDVPVVESPETLILWVTPEVDAVLDIAWLANVFQRDVAEMRYRKILVPEFPIPNVYAAITSEDFIYYRDFMTGLEPPFYNPGNRTMKYYYWANALIGCNPAANAVLFTTDVATVIPTVTMNVTGATLTAVPNNDVTLGGTLQTRFQLVGTVSGSSSGKIAVEPDAATYEVASVEGKPLNSRTYVDAYGVLHVQKTGLTPNEDSLRITAKAAYVNPSGATTEYTASLNVTVVAATAQGAKECAVSTDPYITYTDTTEDVTASE